MSRYIIPIVPETLDLITEMNGGVRPALEEDVQTFFVWNGFLDPSDIISVEPAHAFWEQTGWTSWSIYAQ